MLLKRRDSPTVYQLINIKKPEFVPETLKVNQVLFKEAKKQVPGVSGDVFTETGNKDIALKYFRRSLELNSLNYRVYNLVKAGR